MVQLILGVHDELFIMIALAIFGGMARHAYKIIKDDCHKPPFLLVGMCQLFLSVFTGIIAYMISCHYDMRLLLQGPLVMAAGYSATELVELGHLKLLKRFRRLGDDNDNRSNSDN